MAWRYGAGGTPVVSFHGLLPVASGRIIAEFARELTRLCDATVYGVDAPGFGESPAPPSPDAYAMSALAMRLSKAVTTLAGDRPVLMGHSWGAALACRVSLLLDPPPLGLVLLDGGHFDHADLPEADPTETIEDVRQQLAAMRWLLAASTLDACVEQITGSGASARPVLRDAVRAGLMDTPDGVRSRVSLPAAAAAMHGLMNSRSSLTYRGIAEARIPVLLIAATVPEERAELTRERLVTFRPRLPDLEVVELLSTHDVPVNAPVPAARAVAAWLTGRGIAAPA